MDLIAELKKIENAVKILEGKINKNSTDIAVTEGRVATASQMLTELQEAQNDLRTQRQTALAIGESTTEVSSKLRNVAEEIELKEDEIAGLTAKLEQIEEEKANLRAELPKLKKEIPRAKLRHLAEEYNRVANQLAAIVKQIWEQRYELDEWNNNGDVVAPSTFNNRWCGALEIIPKLFRVEDLPGGPSLFFDFEELRQQKRRERELKRD